MSMVNDILSMRGVYLDNSAPFSDLVYLHDNLLREIEMKRQEAENNGQ